MLQASEYQAPEYLSWFWRAQDLRHVSNRGQLDRTPKARLLLMFVRIVMLLEVLAVIGALWLAVAQPLWLMLAAVIILIYPAASAYSLVGLLWLGRVLIQSRRERAIIQRARGRLKHHAGFRIAIAGSYGKTSFKEMLRTILAEGKSVAATPGNMNTPIGISRFADKLNGTEQVLIFELGEYYPGDVKALSELVSPQMGIITGINEAHLSKFKTLDRTTATIFELADFLGELPVYKNGDNPHVLERAEHGDPLVYSQAGVNAWTVTNITVSLDSTSFTATQDKIALHVRSGLLGRQQVGPLVACIDIAQRLGLTPKQISAGIAKTVPFEHRLQPRQLAGAWIIDDTYNGNSDGVAAGLGWLAAVPARRRVYVTPGLVEQGDKTAEVHQAIGRHIAAVADVVVLIQNSATSSLRQGLQDAHFSGELTVVTDPLKFYSNLDQFVAAGDVVLMQNDWTDNYN